MSSWARFLIRSWTLLFCGLHAAFGWAAERPNPFAPPDLGSSAKSHSVARTTKHTLPKVTPRLRAVLHAPSGSMANLDGFILAERESALGYQLVAVYEHSAEFNYRGQRIRLYVRHDHENASR